jgi:hypothetical protein
VEYLVIEIFWSCHKHNDLPYIIFHWSTVKWKQLQTSHRSCKLLSWASIKWKDSPITIRGSHQQKMLSENGSTQFISPHECW